jgi:regulator of protease activity HflC (stomatin/prohibitin superfamily)
MSGNSLQESGRWLWLAAGPGLVWAGAQSWSLGGTPGLAVFWFFLWLGVQMLAEPGREEIRNPVRRTVFPLLVFVLLGAAGWLVILPGPLAAGGTGSIQIFAYGWLALAVWFFFLERWWSGQAGERAFSSARRGALWLLIGGSVLQAAALWAALYWERAWAERAAWVLLVIVGGLVLEFFVRWVARFYQTPELRGALPGLWQSWFLRALGGGRGGWREVVTAWLGRWEETTGARLQDAQLARQVGKWLIPVVLGAAALAWLSTSWTVVPIGFTGVRETFGRFGEQGLAPGLHASWPTPWGRIHLVGTGAVHSLSVGFVSDLERPVLWNEKHLEGEENFLVGDGDELLTINLPVFWRVENAPQFLVAVQDAPVALSALAQQQLLRTLQGRGIFALMSTEREAVAAEIRMGLTAAVRDLGLGVEILFVGLQDIHPPVQVAEAYQAVAAAEEERQAAIERAVAFRVERTLEAQMESFALRTRAETEARQQLLEMEGRTALLAALQEPAARERAGLFFRLMEEAWERSLAGREKVVLPGDHPESLLLDLRPTEPTITP